MTECLACCYCIFLATSPPPKEISFLINLLNNSLNIFGMRHPVWRDMHNDLIHVYTVACVSFFQIVLYTNP